MRDEPPEKPTPDAGDDAGTLGESPADVKVVDKRWWARAAGDTPAGTALSQKPAYVEELERRAADAAAQAREFATRYREATQEFEQARLRLRREVGREVEREKRTLLSRFLDIIDNLDRAIEAGRATDADSPLLQGVELVRHQFLMLLDSHGVSRIDPLHQPFDPAAHEAVSTATVTDPAQDNLVVGVIRPGYRVGEDVLRPAGVVVGRTADQIQGGKLLIAD